MATVLIQVNGRIAPARQRLTVALSLAGVVVIVSESSLQSLADVAERRPDCIVIPAEAERTEEGASLLSALRRLTGAPIVMVGTDDAREATRALLEGADVALPASVPAHLLVARVRTLLRREGWRGYHGDRMPRDS